MRTVRSWITLFLPLALAAGGCAERKQAMVVAPERPGGDPPAVAEAHWVWDRGPLGAAVAQASSSPLVQRALAESPSAGLNAAFQYALLLEATREDGRRFSVTLLPYVFGRDSTHAAFVLVMRADGGEIAEFSELIVGRDPSPLEPGFEAILWGATTLWVKSGEAYSIDAAAANPAATKRSPLKIFQCMVREMPAGCGAGAAIGAVIGGPAAPASAAIGCGIGAAAGAAACAAEYLLPR